MFMNSVNKKELIFKVCDNANKAIARKQVI